MRVYLEPEGWMSLGIKRVAGALRQFAPKGVTIVATPEEAELQIVHMVGDGQRKYWIEPQRDYAVVQYCLRTTELPNTKDWVGVWSRAKAVWSYYDLIAKVIEDGVQADGIVFYHAPLGVSGVFRPSIPVRKSFLIGTSGYIAETEGVIEAHTAVQRLGKHMFHLGPNLHLGQDITYAHGMQDDELAGFWSLCSFVAGLRRIEGFELPVLEGLMCGARPIVFDAPHYTHWFGEFAEIIPEGTPEEVADSLFSVMAKTRRAVTPAERSRAAELFDWNTIVTGFWEAIL